MKFEVDEKDDLILLGGARAEGHEGVSVQLEAVRVVHHHLRIKINVVMRKIPGSQGQNLAMTVLCVPYSLGSGSHASSRKLVPGSARNAESTTSHQSSIKSPPFQVLDL